MNLVIALLVLGGASVAAWAGLTDPPGGALAAVGRVLRGEPQPARAAPPTASDLLTGSSPGTGATTGTGAALGSRAAVVDQARAQLGKPYEWAGNGPDRYDCSGLTKYVYLHGATKTLPRTAAQQQISTLGVNVALGSVQPGDLVFYGFPASHVAIAIGGGQVIHAPHSGAVVRIESITAAGSPHSPNSARDFLSTPLK